MDKFTTALDIVGFALAVIAGFKIHEAAGYAAAAGSTLYVSAKLATLTPRPPEPPA